MKKLTFYLLLLAATAVFFTSCNKDETNDAAISLAGDEGYTATDATVTAGATFKVKWTATCSTTNMAFVSITKDGTALAAWDKVEIPSASKSTYIAEATIEVPLNTGAYTYAIVIYDKDNVELASKSIVITVETAPIALTTVTFSAVNDAENPGNAVGAGQSARGSYVDLDGGKIYKFTEATSETYKSTIDVIFDQSAFSDNDGASGHFTGTGTNLKVVTVAYADATSSAALTGLSVTTSDKTATVAEGTVIYFETATNKGLLHVITLTPGDNNSNVVTIEAKIMAK